MATRSGHTILHSMDAEKGAQFDGLGQRTPRAVPRVAFENNKGEDVKDGVVDHGQNKNKNLLALPGGFVQWPPTPADMPDSFEETLEKEQKHFGAGLVLGGSGTADITISSTSTDANAIDARRKDFDHENDLDLDTSGDPCTPTTARETVLAQEGKEGKDAEETAITTTLNPPTLEITETVECAETAETATTETAPEIEEEGSTQAGGIQKQPSHPDHGQNLFSLSNGPPILLSTVTTAQGEDQGDDHGDEHEQQERPSTLTRTDAGTRIVNKKRHARPRSKIVDKNGDLVGVCIKCSSSIRKRATIKSRNKIRNRDKMRLFNSAMPATAVNAYGLPDNTNNDNIPIGMASPPPTPSSQTHHGPGRSHSHSHSHSYSHSYSHHTADYESKPAFPRISRPVELMRSSYDVVVIGSGYGGGVAASRMARAGQSVCLLELGKERWPGEYPESVGDAFAELHCSGELQPSVLAGSFGVETGRPTGMYHMIFGKGQNAVVGNGLGGTSLINANIFLRADEKTMAMKAWPQELREKGVLDKYYDKVESVLEPEAYPDDWPALPKLDLLQKQAEHLDMGGKFYRPKQTTRFRNGPNSCGVEMSASTLTGQDCTGVNDGSKTTTLVTYLADAWNWGAEMFCECEVRYIERLPENDKRGGYRIWFAWHGCNRGHFRANLHGDLMWVWAREAVFLGAGSIGTTEILLRCKAMGTLSVSDNIGQNMSGNGDILAFGYNTDHVTNAVGRAHPSPYHPTGPTVTGIIDNRSVGSENPLDGYVIEEGAVPHALARFLQTMLDLMPGSKAPQNETLVQKSQSMLARWGSRLLGPYYQGGAVEHTQVYLIMSHDSNQAVLSLKDDKPVLEFLGVARSDHVKQLNGVLAKATEAVGGTLVGNPFFALMDQQVTVHPIGGAAMASDGTGATGATDHMGRLFTGNGSKVHSGLIVTDGAAIPTALGVNPLATITALAERSVDLYAKSRGLMVRTDDNGLLDLFGKPAHPCHQRDDLVDDFTSVNYNDNCNWQEDSSGNVSDESGSNAGVEDAVVRDSVPSNLEYDWEIVDDNDDDNDSETERESVRNANRIIERASRLRAGGFGFTEVMSGFLHGCDGTSDGLTEDRRDIYELAYRRAESLCESARFFLSVQAFDTSDVVRDPAHRGMLTGTFVCPTLPGSPFMVQRGAFSLFVMDHQAPGTRNMTYDFDLRGTDGHTLHFHGYKVADSSVALAPLQLWRATSTLYVTITRRVRRLREPEGFLVEGSSASEDAWRHEPVLAKGIMHIKPTDFLSEILTLTPTGSSLLQKAMSAASFMTYFTRKSLGLFLAPLTSLQYPSQTYNGYINHTPPTKLWTDIKASDGVHSRLYMWSPLPQYEKKTPDGETPSLLFVPGASVDHQIFALPTIPFNTVNYFTRAGYRVFVMVPRIGQLTLADNNWTTYDARLDIRAAFEKIRAEYGPKKIYTVAHCMGSVALATGLLDATIPADWLLGLSCSQVFMNPIWNAANMIKASTAKYPLSLDRIYQAVAGSWFDCGTSPNDTLVQRLLNQALRLMPTARRELCSSAVCHRISLVYGRCWNHGNLNEATHRQMDRFFGGINMTMLRLLMVQGSEGHVMTNAYEVLTTPQNVQQNLRGLPIFQFVGDDNAVLSPRATEKTYEILCDTFGASGQYRRRIIPGYGHLDCWMGRNAWKDVYPVLRAEVDRVVHGENYTFEEPDASVCRFTRMMEAGEL